MVNWEDCRQFFEPDGSLIDLYVKDAGLAGWSEFLDVAREAGARFLEDGKPRACPATVEEIFVLGREAALTLSMNWGGLLLNSHFFDREELEIDLDPREVNSSDRFDALIAFMRRLAEATRKSVVLTPENCRERPFLGISPENAEIEILWKELN